MEKWNNKNCDYEIWKYQKKDVTERKPGNILRMEISHHI